MAETYLSDAQLAARYGVHRTTPWRWAKSANTFPKPVMLTPGCTRWKLSEIEAWEASRADAAA
jgi:prophage regulatory protein